MKECKHHRTISYCADCHVERLELRVKELEHILFENGIEELDAEEESI